MIMKKQDSHVVGGGVGLIMTIMWITIVIGCASLVLAATPSELLISKQAIQYQLAGLQKQLSDVRLAKYSLSGLKEATGMVSSDSATVSGVSPNDVDALAAEVSDQFQELERHERSIIMKMAIIQRSLEIISVNVTMAGYNPLLKRIASNMFGTTYIAPNGTLFYYGLINNYLLNGRPGFTTSYIQPYPTAVDMSPLEGAVVTQVYAGRTYFFAVTSRGDIWQWGGNDGAIGSVCSCGALPSYGSSYVLRKVDFGLVGKKVIPKKIVCDQSIDNYYNTYSTLDCFVLSMEGELYFLGVWAWDYIGSWGIRSTLNSNKARKFKISIGGVEKFASDFAVSQTAVASYYAGTVTILRNGAAICVIDRDNATSIYCTGDNNGGQFGDGSTAPTIVPTTMDIAAANWVVAKKQLSSDGEIFTQIHGSLKTLYAVGATGKVYTWGSLGALLGRGNAESNTKIGRATFSSSFTTSRICTSPGSDIIYLVSATNNEVYILGAYNGENFDSPYQPQPFRGKQFVDCEVNEQNSFIVFSNGQVYTKGRNDAAHLMIGYTTPAVTANPYGVVYPFSESFIPVYYSQ